MNNRLIIKGIFLSIMFLMFTNIVNAETITYNICKNGCEYDNLTSVVENIESFYDGPNYNSNEVIINFKDNETYTYNSDLMLKYMGKLTINGSNNVIESNEISIWVPNIEINNTTFNLNSENGLYFIAIDITNYSENMYAKLTNVTVNNSYNNSMAKSIFNFGYVMDMYNCDLDTLASFGITNIYNSKINKIANLMQLNCYNCLFEDNLKYIRLLVNSNGQTTPAMTDEEISQYNIIEEDVSAAFGTSPESTMTKIIFDKKAKLKYGDKLTLVDYLDYYTEDKQIEYTIEDESIAKIENKELIGLKAGSTKVTVTTDDGHVVYNIDLTVESSNTGKITKTDSPINNFANSDFSADNLDSIIPLTNEEQSAKDQGTNIDVFLEVKDISNNVSNEDKAKINEKVSNKETLAMYLDVSLFKQIEGQEATKIEETNGNIKVSLKVPENLKNNNPSVIRKYYILRLHDGVVDKLETELNGDTLSFETDKFSTYALTYEDVDNPKTGDSIILYVSLFVISVLSLIIYRKAGNKS